MIRDNDINLRTKGEEVDVSILIRTKDEEDYIEETLKAILSQSYRNFEVIIVDSGSTDKTLEIAKKYPVKIFEISPAKFTYGYSLNYGFQKAQGRYVVCLSAHALPVSENWLKTLIPNFNDDKVAAVACKALPRPDCNPFDRRGLLKKFNIQKKDVTDGPLFFFSNANSVIKKDVWKEVPFDEKLIAAEDADWLQKIKKLKYKIVYEPKAEVYHSHNETLRQIYRRHYCESYAFKLIKVREYSLLYILFDLIAGSIYDMGYVLFKRDNLKWFFFAPLRRLAINYSRFKGTIKKSQE